MITIKKFKTKDVDYIIRWFSNKNNRLFQKTKTINYKEALNLIHSSKKRHVYCIFLNNNPIGYGILKNIPDNPYIGINIDESFWGNGYGTKAMKLLEKEAKKFGCQKISLLVDENNIRALNLYKKLKYKDTNLKLMEKKI